MAVLLTALATIGSAMVGIAWSVAAISAQAGQHPDPWTPSQIVTAGELAKELGSSSTRPTVVCVGVPALFRAGHVPGATLHGPASSAEGMANLKQWAENLPRSTNLVVYCGCCPFAQCPNIRPAVAALRAMGFTHLRVLELPNSFGADWATKNYPVER